jgi:4'-phosphopantetheinyl transferase
MIKVYYAYAECIGEDALFQEIKPLSERVQSRLESFKRKEDRLIRMTAYYLLKEALEKNGYSGYRLQDLQYTTGGKPYFPDASFDFSVSHTDQCAAVAISDSRVGIDIEKIKTIDFVDFEDIFPGEVWSAIHISADKTGTFYSYWTQLESVVKADGRGLPLISSNHLEIKAHHVLIEGERWHTQHLNFDPSVSCCIASDRKPEIIKPTEVKLPLKGHADAF